MYDFRRGGRVSDSESLIAFLQGSGKHTYWPAGHRRARARIAALRENIAANKLRAMGLFALVCLIWTAAYSLSLVAYPDQNLAVHLSPHIAYLPLFWGVILFQRRMIWFPVALFAGLYAFTVLVAAATGDAMTPGHGSLYAFAFVANLVVGVQFGMAADRLIAGKGRVNALGFGLERALLAFAFVSSVVGALLTFAVLEIFSQARAISGDGVVGSNLFDQFLFVHSRGVRSGMISIFVAILCTSRVRFRDIYSVAAAFPILAGVLLFQNENMAHHLEVVFVVLLLAFAILFPPVSVALLGLSGAFAFAMSSGTFVLTDEALTGDAVFSEVWSSILFVLVAFLLIRTSRTDKQDGAVRDAVRGIEVIRKAASVGRFNLNADNGFIKFDEVASGITGLPPSTSLKYFRRSLSPDSVGKFDSILNTTTGDRQEVTLKIALETSGRYRNLIMYAWPDVYGDEIGVNVRGYIVGIDAQGSILPHGLRHRPHVAKNPDQGETEELLPTLSAKLASAFDEYSGIIADIAGPDIPPQAKARLATARCHLLNEIAKFKVLSPGSAQGEGPRATAFPSEVFERVVANQAEASADWNFKLTVLPVPPLDRPEVLDVERLAAILGKLVLGAALHSDGSGVWLSYFRETDDNNQSWSVWTVEDDGKGLEETGVFASGPEGNGLFLGSGMRTVRMSVEAMGGSLRSFPGIRGGARIEIRLPFLAENPDQVHEPPVAPLGEEHWIVADTDAEEGEALTLMLSSMVKKVSFVANFSQIVEFPQDSGPDVVLFDLSNQDQGTLRKKLMSIKARWHHVRLIGISSEPMARVPSGLVEQILQRPIVERQLRTTMSGRTVGWRASSPLSSDLAYNEVLSKNGKANAERNSNEP